MQIASGHLEFASFIRPSLWMNVCDWVNTLLASRQAIPKIRPWDWIQILGGCDCIRAGHGLPGWHCESVNSFYWLARKVDPVLRWSNLRRSGRHHLILRLANSCHHSWVGGQFYPSSVHLLSSPSLYSSPLLFNFCLSLQPRLEVHSFHHSFYLTSPLLLLDCCLCRVDFTLHSLI